ncbi:MAG TPA: A/G-specific adenine glycosylase [Anaeromyxobacteraceae bacterium]|nr:A/G-specific adenine glycosylase [Anaeromyxobacteraceae bacterium]
MGTIPSKARTAAIRRRLLRWWGAARRGLPWRFPPGEADPYRVWISEVMLQQTQVATVVPYYRRFLARLPTLEALAAADEGEVLELWSGLGYYARARALHGAARQALAEHGGLPSTLAALRALPGFGPYTAGAVASIAFGVRTTAVDGNAGRVLSRLFLVDAARGSSRFRTEVGSCAEALVECDPGRGDSAHPGELNQALIELGALVCRPGIPRCERCPLTSHCAARRAGRERALPRVRERAAPRRLRVAVAVCRRGGRVLLVRRPDRGLFAGMWGPPAVELANGQDPAAAIAAAIGREPFGITGGFGLAGTVERTLTHRRLELVVFEARLGRLPPRRRGWTLARPAELGAMAIPVAMRHALALCGDGAGGADGNG